IGDAGRNVAVVSLRRLAILAELDRPLLVAGGFLLIERPVTGLGAIKRAGLEHDLSRVDSAACLRARMGLETDDLRDHRPRELGPEAAFRTRRVPHAEDEGRRAQLEQGRGLTIADVVELLTLVRLSERLPVQQAVAENRVGDPMRGLKAGDPQR